MHPAITFCIHAFREHRGLDLKRVVIATVLSLVLPAMALGHGPSRKKEVTTIEINAPADKVWEVVGNYQDMSWHPAIASAEVTGGNEVDVAKRKLTFKSGAVFTDTLTKYEPKARSIAFLTDVEDLKTLPVEGYSTTLTVADVSGKSSVEWKGAFYRGYMNNDPPPELSDEAATKAVIAFQNEGPSRTQEQARGREIAWRDCAAKLGFSK